MTRLHFVVSGRVQGVGYRWYVVRCAQGLGLRGWTRNHWNGTVEVEAEGTDEVLTEFERLLKAGPENPGRVDRLEKQAVAPKGSKQESDFDIRF